MECLVIRSGTQKCDSLRSGHLGLRFRGPSVLYPKQSLAAQPLRPTDHLVYSDGLSPLTFVWEDKHQLIAPFVNSSALDTSVERRLSLSLSFVLHLTSPARLSITTRKFCHSVLQTTDLQLCSIGLLSCNVWWTATLRKLGDRKVKGRWKSKLKAKKRNVYLWVTSSEVWPQQKGMPVPGNEPRHSHASTAEVRHAMGQACLVCSVMLITVKPFRTPCWSLSQKQHYCLKMLPCLLHGWKKPESCTASGMTFLWSQLSWRLCVKKNAMSKPAAGVFCHLPSTQCLTAEAET